MEKHVKEKFDQFLKKLNYSEAIEFLVFMGRESESPQNIMPNNQNSKIGYPSFSDKCGNAFSPFSVGRVTGEIFNANLDVPFWVVK